MTPGDLDAPPNDAAFRVGDMVVSRAIGARGEFEGVVLAVCASGSVSRRGQSISGPYFYQVEDETFMSWHRSAADLRLSLE